FVLLLLLYVLTVASNLLLTAVICLSRSLHQPMYVLLCSLFVNELYGSTALVPFLLLQILSDLHAVSAPFCFLQIFCVYTYVNVEFCTLAVMAYDRFVAICQPLQYHLRMSLSRTLLLVFVLWLYSFLKCLSTLALSLQLQRCGVAINSLYCHNYLVVKLSCSDTRVNNIYGLLGLVRHLLSQALVLLSYCHIFSVMLKLSGESQRKALQTCTPHLVVFINFSGAAFCGVTYNRLSANIPKTVNILACVSFFLVPPLFNPIIYGIKMKEIR
uniref:Olfactory receptor n=1 Tax=Tetraodon nigroviridis TaxID=99883 RepID=H3C7W1_TETNG